MVLAKTAYDHMYYCMNRPSYEFSLFISLSAVIIISSWLARVCFRAMSCFDRFGMANSQVHFEVIYAENSLQFGK